MKLSGKQYTMVERLLESWTDQDLLSNEQADKLKEHIEIKVVNWKRVAQNMLGLAIVFMVIAFLHLVADEWVLEVLSRFFELSDAFFMFLLLFLALAFPWFASRVKLKSGALRVSVEAFLLLGIMSLAGACYYASDIFKLSPFWEVGSVLLVAIYGMVVARMFYAPVIWLTGMSGLALWLGLETARLSGWEPLFLGMTFQLRFLVMAFLTLMVMHWLRKLPFKKVFRMVSFQFVWFVFWVALWLCALFGNYSSWDAWEAASAVHLLPWGVVMALAALWVWQEGVRKKRRQWVWMGSIAFFADVYTQYFLFLWDPLPASLFFFLLALSFFLVGRKAEVIWGRP
jgi:hypothetical protein